MSDDVSLASRALIYSSNTSTTVDTIIELGKADVKRRNVIKAPFVLAALAAPSRDWLVSTLDETTSDRGPRKVGLRQVAGIREMFALFQEMDVMRGGGHARTALLEYMNSYVLPLTREKHEETVQRAIYEAAAEQAYLVGWMAYDDGQHGLAQRYLIQSLRLANASGNAVLGAHVLAGMSDQANLLGHPHEALMLARAGRRGITVNDSPACLADLHILESRALAVLGDSRGASAAVANRRTLFSTSCRKMSQNGSDPSTYHTFSGKQHNRSATSNNLIRSSVLRRNPQQWQNNKAGHAAVRLVTLRSPSAHWTVTTLKPQPLPASTSWTWPRR
jgi:hypothetical protein